MAGYAKFALAMAGFVWVYVTIINAVASAWQ